MQDTLQKILDEEFGPRVESAVLSNLQKDQPLPETVAILIFSRFQIDLTLSSDDKIDQFCLNLDTNLLTLNKHTLTKAQETHFWSWIKNAFKGPRRGTFSPYIQKKVITLNFPTFLPHIYR